MKISTSSLLAMALALIACTERDEACYERNPDPEASVSDVPRVCGKPYGYQPESPAGLEDRGPYHVIHCEAPGTGSTCETCPAQDVNERIVEQILSVMIESEMEARCAPAEVDEIIPGCVTIPETESDRCCFSAWYWGSCNIKG